jgi:16S rRNA processing protein RimM
MGSSPRILVGRFGAPHGVRGEVRVKSFTGDPLALAAYDGLSDASGARAFRIESARLVKDDMLVVRIEGVRDRTAAEALVNCDLYLPRAALPQTEDDEFYVADLIGLDVVSADGAPLGSVRDVLNYGAGDILDVLRADGASMLVPFTKAAVPHVDMAARRVTVDPPVETEGEETPGA